MFRLARAPFTFRFRRPFPAHRMAASAGACVLAALLILGTAALAPYAYAQPTPRPAAPPPKPVKPPFPPEAQALLSPDTDAWMAGAAALRANPRAREILLQALQNRPNNPRRWRLAFHLIEFGQADDVALLDTLLDEADGPERRAIVGALTALYPRPSTAIDLPKMVAEFTFAPQNAPEPFAPDTAGKVVVNDLAIQAYHQDNLPVRMIERVMGLKGRAYDGKPALAAAMQNQLAGSQWKDYGDRLMAPLTPIPARLSESGTLQIRFANPATRPVLLVGQLTAWYGRFDQAPAPLYVLIPPGGSVTEEVPVRIIAPADPGKVRVFLRFAELNATGAPEAAKLEIALHR